MILHNEALTRGLCVNHLKRPSVCAAWSLWCVFLKWQQGSQEVGWGGEAGGAPPSLAAGDTYGAGMSGALRDSTPKINSMFCQFSPKRSFLAEYLIFLLLLSSVSTLKMVQSTFISLCMFGNHCCRLWVQ